MDGFAAKKRVEKLRPWRNGRSRDLTLGELSEQVERLHVKPHKQIGHLIETWRELLPSDLYMRTKLASLSRGVLTVHAADSATLYELDRLLRGGIERKMIASSKVPMRKVKTKVASLR